MTQRAAVALALVLCARAAAAQAPAGDPQRPAVEFLPRIGVSHVAPSICRATTCCSCGTPTSAASSTSSTTGTGRADVRGELPGDPRRRVPSLRSEPGQLHPRAARRRARAAASSWPASSTTSPGTSPIGQQCRRRLEHDRRPGAARVHGRSDARGRSGRCERRRAEVVRGLPLGDRRGRAQPTCRFARASACSGRRRSAHLGVDGTQNRGNQTGFRGEGGLRVEGGAGAMEFFLAVERRVDPYPLEFGTASWVTVGFRLLSR